jgi:hypothetical protein
MSALALEYAHVAAPARRSAAHRVALALVWLTVASGAIVFSEPAPVDVAMLGLAALLPLIGLARITPALLALLAALMVLAAATFLAATQAREVGAAVTHTGVSLYLYVTTIVLAAFIARKAEPHARLVLGAYAWAATAAALAGIVGYFDLVPGAHDLLTRYDRAAGLFKDPNVFGPFLVPAFLLALHRLTERRARRSLIPLASLLLLGLAILLAFSRGAWLNLAIAVVAWAGLRVLTAPTRRARAKVLALALTGGLAGAALTAGALQLDGVADLAAERTALMQNYDEGPEGRFGGQERAARLAVQYPFGIGAQQFVPHYHHEEPHNVYLAMFLNAGWLGGLLFLGLLAATAWHGAGHALRHGGAQPLFLVAYAALLGTLTEGLVIDIDHWRHFYLLLALVWGMMAAGARPCH